MWGWEKRRGAQGSLRLAIGGAKLFYKEVYGGQQIDGEVYFNRGPLAKMGKAV